MPTLIDPMIGIAERQIIPWRKRLEMIVATMREISLHTDPEAMVRAYSESMRQLFPNQQYLAISRRDLPFPKYRITRSSRWKEAINPWKQKDRLPILEGGLLGELLYGDVPRIIDDLDVPADDPAYDYLTGMGTLMAIPHYQRGVGTNMAVILREEPGSIDPESLPEHVWLSNLFGRATHNLALMEELQQAYSIVDRELRHVADMQRALLPKTIPDIPGLSLAAHYRTSRWAGGDYYDFFPLPEGMWGLLIADVSGHGTPAAVMMAVTHAIAHTYPGKPQPPGLLLEHVNEQLVSKYTSDNEMFITAFYGIFDPKRKELTYANAGHNPPRLKRCADGSIFSVDGITGLPLGLFPGQVYAQNTLALESGDQIVLYTDGVLDAMDPQEKSYGLNRLDRALRPCRETADELLAVVLEDLEAFTAGHAPPDDQTLMIAKVM